MLEEEILSLEKRIGEIDMEIEKLYEKHNVSKEKAEFIEECDSIASVLNQFMVRLRKNKVHLLQEKTFEMYRLLSSRIGLIKDLTIDDKTYEVRISDRNGHENQEIRSVGRRKGGFRRLSAVGAGANQSAQAANSHRYPTFASGQHPPGQYRQQLLSQRRGASGDPLHRYRNRHQLLPEPKAASERCRLSCL